MATATEAGTGYAATLCRDDRQFAGLEEEWGRLHRSGAAATPFQSHSWLHSWWLSYGTPGRLRVVLVRRGGTLVGAAPLMLVHRPLPLLVPLGGGISDFSDILVDDSHAPGVLNALADGLRRAGSHAVIDLREVRPGAAAEQLFDVWPGARRRLSDSVCLELPAEPIEELMKRLASSRAQRVRAKLRKVDALRIEEHAVAEHEVASTIRELLRLHELQWRGRGVTPEHLKPRFAEHLTRATRRMVRDGDAALTEYRLDGAVVAANVTLQSAHLTGGYLYGADPELRTRKVDVATMLLRRDAQHAVETGRSVISLLRGTEPYKTHWRPATVTNQRLLLAPSALAPMLSLYAAQLAGRDRATEVLRSLVPAVREWRVKLNNWRAGGGR
ncbi:GNAT family N-acetyltransferase [Streptomyces himalayensis]|uniref:GNAT family N-acetyltransferase n=1 Tax=Streptomyces himalayensis subsp. himalayensis TaxID=2756131 RepID=A0A7W0IDA8_9ACTN|nr:GNAT family N-acetyltransferase [Streptomyces himalayensis]MBA2951528.1 GNAT family N-acetyltransferase [Streptomyces himalayensis subsp. himalayensis]